MGKETKNQHYVPQFYLRRFANEYDRICVYDLKEKELRDNQHPKKYAAGRYFYDVTKAELKEILKELVEFKPELEYQIDYDDDQFIEHYFSKSELDAQNIMNLVENEPHRLREKVFKQKLISFLYDLSIRTELLRKQFEYINSKQNELAEIVGARQLLIDAEYQAKMSQLKSLFSVSNLYKIAEMLERNYDWYIGNNVSELSFITTDNPLPGLSAGFNDICFPISKSKAIVLRTKNNNGYLISKDMSKDGVTIDLSHRSVYLYNSYLIANGYRYAFGDKKSFLTMKGIDELLDMPEIPQRPF